MPTVRRPHPRAWRARPRRRAGRLRMRTSAFGTDRVGLYRFQLLTPGPYCLPVDAGHFQGAPRWSLSPHIGAGAGPSFSQCWRTVLAHWATIFRLAGYLAGALPASAGALPPSGGGVKYFTNTEILRLDG